MGKNKKDILCLIYVPFAMFFIALAGHISVDEFYTGAPFLAAVEYQTNFFLVFFARVLFAYGEFEGYFHGYGVVTVIRHRKKQRLLLHSIGMLFKKLLLYQAWTLVCACFFSALLLGGCDILNGIFWRNVVFYCAADVVLALFQMLLEIVWDGRIGICGSGVYYILSLLLSDKLYFLPAGKKWMWVFLPNLGNAKRIEECGYETGMVLLLLILAGVLILTAGGFAVRKKDIL